MTLTTHAIVGASIANVLPNNPVLGFTIGFASHFLLDAIPHWDYALLSSKKDLQNPMNNDMVIDKNFIVDLFKIGTDVFLGFIIVLFLFGISNSNLIWMPIWGMLGSIIPDALQFIYFKWRHEPIKSLQKFHIWIHGTKELNDRPVLGIFLQITLIICSVIISKLIVF